jgi:hypothetical protein
MANVNITQLPAVTTMKGTDEFPIGRDGTTTNKVTYNTLSGTLNQAISGTIKQELSPSGVKTLAWARWTETSTGGVENLIGYNVSSITKPTTTGRQVNFTNSLGTSNYIVIPNAKHSDTASNVFGSNYAAEGVANDENSCYVNYYAVGTLIFRFSVLVIG